MCFTFGSQHSGTCTRQRSCVVVLSGWVPNDVREHAVANPSWVEDAPDTTTPHLFRKDVQLQAAQKTQHHLDRFLRVFGKTSSDIHVAITWMSVRFKGLLW